MIENSPRNHGHTRHAALLRGLILALGAALLTRLTSCASKPDAGKPTPSSETTSPIITSSPHAPAGGPGQPDSSPTPPRTTVAAASDPAPAPAHAPAPAPPSGLREVFPHVRVDVAARLVEFDGRVPIDCHQAETPRVYLEVIVCTPDTREHESLVLSSAKAAHVHAALLMVGAEPGEPGRVEWDGVSARAVPPRGTPLEVALVTRQADGSERSWAVHDWIVDAETGNQSPPLHFVFGGSALVNRKDSSGTPAPFYHADGAGTLVGFATFGTETISPKEVFSPESGISAPQWIASTTTTPLVGTPVKIVVRVAR